MRKVFGIVILIATVIVGCKDKTKEDTQVDNFDKKSLLENLANNLILPNYNAFHGELLQLQLDYSALIASPSATTLAQAQAQLKLTYFAWQKAKPFEVGPAMTIGLRSSIGTFPSDTTKIQSNFTNGGYVLGSVDNTDACGLSALEFMLFRANALSYFSDPAYAQYGTDVLAKIKTEFDYVLNQWNNGYKSTFISGTGTESTSPFSQLVNEFNKDYEFAKSASLGIPMGKYSLGILRPEFIEAPYSGISLDLIETSMEISHKIFNGISHDGSNNGVGFDDYLNALDKATLTASINNKYAEIFSSRAALSGTLQENLNNNFAGLDHLYLKISEMVVMIKTDMPSSFAVLITYQDNDGD